MQQTILNRTLLLLWKQALTTTKAGLIASLLLLLAAFNPAYAGTNFYKNFVVLNGVYYNTFGSSSNAQFQGTNLGTFNVRNGSLQLGTQGNFYLEPYNNNNTDDDVQAVEMYYRVYQQGTTAGPFTRLDMTFFAAGIDGNNNRRWNNITSNPNLLSGINPAATGTYVLEVYYEGDGTYYNGPNNPRLPFTFYDNRSGPNYQATFTVTNNIQWTGNGTDNNWFTASNWNPAVVPSSIDDVIIPNLGSTTSIPTITYSSAMARNLTITGTGQSSTTNPNQRAQLQLTAGELWVYGNFSDAYGGLKQSAGVFRLEGTGPQTFDGTTFTDFLVDGDGDKTLTPGTNMLVNNSLKFSPNVRAKIITSNSSSTNSNQDGITLLGAAILSGETEASYIQGLIRATQTVDQGIPQNFGGIGVEITTQDGAAGNTTVLRETIVSYQGVNNSASIRRSFNFTTKTTALLTTDMKFSYLDGELNGISESNLRLFRTYTGAMPFANLGATSVDTNNDVLIRTGIVGVLASATFTLGDATRPLPVTLVSFAATATAQGAALRWSTASEVNSKGFGVERQLAGGTNWQSVGYVTASNLASGSSYDYLDKTLPASATQVYYRLREEDQNGTLSYSPVAAISRAAAGADLTLSPVPLQAGPLTVSFAEAGQAGTEILVLNMQGQRMLHYTTTASADGGVNLALDNLAAGVYLVSVQVPGQAARHARFVKN